MLLEREGLLGLLGQRLADAVSGAGSFVLIAGEAGAGKTSLVRAFARSVSDVALVIEGACDPLSTPRPLSPLYDFASDPDAGLDDLLLTSDDNIEIFNALLDRLRHSIRPVLMVVEDIHWADQATLDFIRFIGRRVTNSKGVVVCTYRDDEIGPDHPLRPVLGQLIPLASTTRSTVPPLSPDAVATLALGAGVDAHRLHNITGGNAFFVTEVIAGSEELPATVQDAVLARLSRLDPGSREVVHAVSIAPRALEVDRALLLVGGDPENIDRAVSSGVILGDGKSLRFRHELARAAVEASVPPAQRFALHGRMLALLLEEEPPDHARLAHHAIQAESPELIIEHAPAAALEATKRGARKEAISFYEATLGHTDLLGPDRTAETRVVLAGELRFVDRHGLALEQADLAADYFRRTNQPEGLAEALGQKMNALWSLNRIDEGWEEMDEALDVLRPLGATEMLAKTLYRAGHSHMLARHADPAFESTLESAQVAREVGSADVAWLADMMTGCIHVVVGHAREGLEILKAVRDSAKRDGNHLFIEIALGMLGSGGGEVRLYDDALQALDEGIEHGLATDADYTVAYARAWQARIAFEQGRWDDAVEVTELVDQTSVNRQGIAILTALGALGRVRVRRGDPGGRALLEEVIEIGRNSELQHVWPPISGLAEHHWLAGAPEMMTPVLEDAYRRALDTDSQWAKGEIGFWMWRAGAIDGPPDNAAEPFRLQMSGHWRESAESWQEIGCPYEVAMALADGPNEAKLEALEIFDSLGARPIAEMVRKQLREAGVESIPRGPTKETLANPAGLTSRQLEVMQLVAGGLTNSQIADRLYLSKKTVEHHVSAIFSKLGVDSRVKAINAAEQMGAIKR